MHVEHLLSGKTDMKYICLCSLISLVLLLLFVYITKRQVSTFVALYISTCVFSHQTTPTYIFKFVSLSIIMNCGHQVPSGYYKCICVCLFLLLKERE